MLRWVVLVLALPLLARAWPCSNTESGNCNDCHVPNDHPDSVTFVNTTEWTGSTKFCVNTKCGTSYNLPLQNSDSISEIRWGCSGGSSFNLNIAGGQTLGVSNTIRMRGNAGLDVSGSITGSATLTAGSRPIEVLSGGLLSFDTGSSSGEVLISGRMDAASFTSSGAQETAYVRFEGTDARFTGGTLNAQTSQVDMNTPGSEVRISGFTNTGNMFLTKGTIVLNGAGNLACTPPASQLAMTADSSITASGSQQVTMNSGFLTGTGSITAATEINAGAAVHPGNPDTNSREEVGSFSFNTGGVAFTSSTLLLDVVSPTVYDFIESDQTIQVAGVTELRVEFLPGFSTGGKTQRLDIIRGTVVGDFSPLYLGVDIEKCPITLDRSDPTKLTMVVPGDSDCEVADSGFPEQLMAVIVISSLVLVAVGGAAAILYVQYGKEQKFDTGKKRPVTAVLSSMGLVGKKEFATASKSSKSRGKHSSGAGARSHSKGSHGRSHGASSSGKQSRKDSSGKRSSGAERHRKHSKGYSSTGRSESTSNGSSGKQLFRDSQVPEDPGWDDVKRMIQDPSRGSVAPTTNGGLYQSGVSVASSAIAGVNAAADRRRQSSTAGEGAAKRDRRSDGKRARKSSGGPNSSGSRGKSVSAFSSTGSRGSTGKRLSAVSLNGPQSGEALGSAAKINSKTVALSDAPFSEFDDLAQFDEAAYATDTVAMPASPFPDAVAYGSKSASRSKGSRGARSKGSRGSRARKGSAGKRDKEAKRMSGISDASGSLAPSIVRF